MMHRHGIRTAWRYVGLPALVAMAGCAGAPLYPVVSTPTVTPFRAPYEAVWQATLQSLGITPLRLVDRAQGRIVTEPFAFHLPVQAGGGRRNGSVTSQVLWVSLDIRVLPAPEGATAVHAQSIIHHALEYGFWPQAGGPNSPEADLYSRIAERLSRG